MKRLLAAKAVALVGLFACSAREGSGEATHAPSEPTCEPAAGVDADGAGPADRGADSGARSNAGDSGSKPSAAVGRCASCTATACGPELRACASTMSCVDALVAINDCFAKQTDGTSGSCGSTFAANGGQDAAALWACDTAKCTSECGAP